MFCLQEDQAWHPIETELNMEAIPAAAAYWNVKRPYGVMRWLLLPGGVLVVLEGLQDGAHGTIRELRGCHPWCNVNSNFIP